MIQLKLAIADILAVPAALTTSTANFWIFRSRRRRDSPGRGLDSPKAWTTRARCARTWSGRRRKSREFQPTPEFSPPFIEDPLRWGEEGARSIASSAGEKRERAEESAAIIISGRA